MILKKLLFAAVITSTLFAASCLKNDVTTTTDTKPVQDPSLEMNTIDSFTKAMGYSKMQYDVYLTGFKYEIVELGDTTTGNLISSTHPVGVVKYVGKLLNGNNFDSTYKLTDSAANIDIYNNYYNNNLIYAWGYLFLNRAIPAKIGKGGRIRFVTPSKYAYGPYTQGSIPANSPLFFDLELKDVRSY